MSFVQTIEITTSNVDAVKELLERWHAEQKGTAPGYQGARVLADESHTGRYLIEVDFSSREEADANNERPETGQWASRLQELVDGAPTFTNYGLAYATG